MNSYLFLIPNGHISSETIPQHQSGTITVAIDAKIEMLKCLYERLHYVTGHDAYISYYATFNIHLAESDPSWTQSTLPVRHGGFGILSAVQLAPSAFLVQHSLSQQ